MKRFINWITEVILAVITFCFGLIWIIGFLVIAFIILFGGIITNFFKHEKNIKDNKRSKK